MFFKTKKKTGDSKSATAPAANGGGATSAVAPAPPKTAAAARQVSGKAGAPPPGEPAIGEPSPEEVGRRRAYSKRIAASLGEIVSVLMRSKELRNLTLADVEKLIVPAIASGQFIIAETEIKGRGFTAPLAVALWASVSEEVDRRLAANVDRPFQLARNEWRSGTIPWLVVVAGDRRVLDPMLKQLQGTVLKGRPLKMRLKGNDGRHRIGIFGQK